MSAKRTPAPTAPYGTLLWLIQYAHQNALHEGRGHDEKTLVLEHARVRAAELADTTVPQGLIDFVKTCETPWAVLAARLMPSEYVTQARKLNRARTAGVIS